MESKGKVKEEIGVPVIEVKVESKGKALRYTGGGSIEEVMVEHGRGRRVVFEMKNEETRRYRGILEKFEGVCRERGHGVSGVEMSYDLEGSKETPRISYGDVPKQLLDFLGRFVRKSSFDPMPASTLICTTRVTDMGEYYKQRLELRGSGLRSIRGQVCVILVKTYKGGEMVVEFEDMPWGLGSSDPSGDEVTYSDY